MGLALTEKDGTPLRVSLPVFEGPLDLLLYLIKKDEVDIYDVQIERITGQYLAYLEAMQELDLEIAGEFLVMAANLVYLKSRTLLPVDQQAAEEDAEEDDPRWDLIRQLVEYKKFKEAAAELEERETLQELIYRRKAAPPVVMVSEGAGETNPFGRVTMLDLIHAFQKVLDRARAKQGFREIYEERYTVADKIEFILDIVARADRVMFSSLFQEMTSRSEIVVTFLALLELIRLKHLRVRQPDPLGEIEISSRTNHGTEINS
ncbi:MAG: segregation/condensation protein A [Candidatus Methylacidiphilales bacterium]